MAMQENRPVVCQILRSLRETGRVDFYTECVIKKIYLMGLVCEESGALLHCWYECKRIQPLWEGTRVYLLNERNGYV